jgi:ParB family chromosome partitioning protein
MVKQGWNVRKVEEVVRQALEGPKKVVGGGTKKLPPYLIDLEDKLRSVFGTQVRIRPSSRGGKIEVSYYSEEDLERIIELLQK